MKNTLTDLNNHLFEQLERLNEDDLDEETLERELKRADGMTKVASQIIQNAELAYKTMVHMAEYGYRSAEEAGAPEMLALKGGTKMNVRYPPEVHEFIRQHCKGRSCVELTELVNQHMGTEFTPSKMHAYLGNHKLTLGTPGGNPKGYSPKYPTEMREFVKSMAPGRKTSELLDMVNARFGADTITLQHLRAFMKNHGILNGLESRFQKGHVPYSKGKKQTEFMSAAGIERTKATRFQPGQTPANLLPVGAIVRNPEGYLLRKRAMRGGQWERWEFLHRAIWEEHHGPIPEGLMVSFKNGNKEDCSIDNLMLISNAENLELSRSKLRFDERELTDAGLVVAKLKLKARERRKR